MRRAGSNISARLLILTTHGSFQLQLHWLWNLARRLEAATAIHRVRPPCQSMTGLRDGIARLPGHSQRLASTAAQTVAANAMASKTAALPMSLARLDNS